MKIRIILITIAAFFVFQGSSPWEGAAAVAPVGELPATGRFIATNSFPRNTVVDITNIETNRSIRVIVANTLDSPGLLAIVSHEAAELIGLRPGSIGRIRMVQPSEPIAFMRFLEGSPATIDTTINGIEPDNFFMDDTFTLPDIITQIPAVSPVENTVRPPYIVNDLEWAGIGRLNIVEIPVIEQPQVIQIQEPEQVAVVEPVVEQPQVIQIEESPRVAVIEPVVEQPQVIQIQEPEPEQVAVVEQIVEQPQVIQIEEPQHVVVIEPVVEQPQVIQIQEPEQVAVVEPDIEPQLVAVIEPVVEQPLVIQIQEPERAAVVEPVVEQPRVTITPEQPVFNFVETDELRLPPVTGIYGIDPSLIIPGITVVEPVQTFTPPPVVSGPTFSVNTISRLDRGRFYVQIAAFQTVNQVESIISQIDRRYNPVVFIDGGNFYRVLIGPLNEGESAAILARFRSIGYTDAFVRRGS